MDELFYNCRERREKISLTGIITNRRRFVLIRTQFVLHSAYSQLIRDLFLNLLIGLLYIVVNSALRPNPDESREYS